MEEDTETNIYLQPSPVHSEDLHYKLENEPKPWNESDFSESEIEDSLNSKNIVISNNLHNAVVPVPPSLTTSSCVQCMTHQTDYGDESTLQCYKCKSDIHYTCTRLPGYMLCLLKTTEFFYVCECCVNVPDEYSLYDNNKITHDVNRDIDSESDSGRGRDINRDRDRLKSRNDNKIRDKDKNIYIEKLEKENMKIKNELKTKEEELSKCQKDIDTYKTYHEDKDSDSDKELDSGKERIRIRNMDRDRDNVSPVKMMNDINSSLHGLSNSVDSIKTLIPERDENIQQTVIRLEKKIASLEGSIEERLPLKRDHNDEDNELVEFSISHNNQLVTRLEEKISSLEEVIEERLPTICEDEDGENKQLVERSMTQTHLEENIACQQQEIDMLEVVIADKNIYIERLEEENMKIKNELEIKEVELSKCQEDIDTYKTHGEKQKSLINKLKARVKTLQGQDVTKAMEKVKDKKVHELYEKLRNATEIIPRTHNEICKLQKSFNVLQNHVQKTRTNTHHIKLNRKDSNMLLSNIGEDVVIVHDSYFKYIPNNMEMLSIRKIYTPTLDEAYTVITNLRTNPNVILLHTGTADLVDLTEHTMVERVMKIYEYIRNRGIRFIFSCIPLRKGEQFDMKVQLFNAMVVSKLSYAEGVTICRNDETTKTFNDEPLHTINLIQP